MNVLFRQLRDDQTVAFTLDHAATVKRALIVRGKRRGGRRYNMEMASGSVAQSIVLHIATILRQK